MIDEPQSRGPARPVGASRATATAVLLLAGVTTALAACSSPSTAPSASSVAQVSSGTASTWVVGSPGISGVQPSAGGAPSTGRGSTAAPVPPDASTGPVTAGRVRQVPPGPRGSTRVTAGGEVWMISRPAGAPAGYAELLALDASGARVLHAYGFPDLAPQWLLVTPEAVYCGRHGDAAAADAMVCRVDRSTFALTVRISAGTAPHTAVTERQVAGRPGTWTVDDRAFAVDLGTPPQVGVELTFRSGEAQLSLDADTLTVLGS